MRRGGLCRPRHRLKELIEDKKKGKPVKSSKPDNDDGKVVDLMEALRKSLSGGGAQRATAERFAKKKQASKRGRTA